MSKVYINLADTSDLINLTGLPSLKENGDVRFHEPVWFNDPDVKEVILLNSERVNARQIIQGIQKNRMVNGNKISDWITIVYR